MTIALQYPSFAVMRSSGASDTAESINQTYQQLRGKLQGSYVLGQRAKGWINDLYRMFEECRHANWNGYEAVPVSEYTREIAHELLEAMPLGIPAPSIGAEPDGHITMEWYDSPRCTLSISIDPEYELHYAALIGASKVYGTEPFFGEVPKKIMDLIRQVIA